jgi:hypothetical protein
VTVIASSNSALTISSLSPTFVSAGSTGFTLTVNGSGFTTNSRVFWNLYALSTQYVSGTQLTAQVPAGDASTSGTTTITVQTPPPGGGISNRLQFEVDSVASGSTIPPSFEPESVATTPGGTASYQVTLSPSVTIDSVMCLNLPSGATCNYTASSGALTLSTTSATPVGTYQITVVFAETMPVAASGIVPFLLLPLVIVKSKRKSRATWVIACIGITLCFVLATVGCGSSQAGGVKSQPQTMTSSGNVTLTVQ